MESQITCLIYLETTCHTHCSLKKVSLKNNNSTRVCNVRASVNTAQANYYCVWVVFTTLYKMKV